MDVLTLLRHVRSQGVGVERRGDTLIFRHPRRAEVEVRQLGARKPEVLAALEAEQAGPWPKEEWGPLFVEHFGIKTLDDLERLPRAGTGDGGEVAR